MKRVTIFIITLCIGIFVWISLFGVDFIQKTHMENEGFKAAPAKSVAKPAVKYGTKSSASPMASPVAKTSVVLAATSVASARASNCNCLPGYIPTAELRVGGSHYFCKNLSDPTKRRNCY